MNRIIVGAAALLAVGCAETVSSPEGTPVPELTMPSLIVSEPRAVEIPAAAFHGSASEVTWVSLPPETLAGIALVRIRNLTSDGMAVAVWVVDGGFDPVALAANAGDQLELQLVDASEGVTLAHARVPVRRPPVIVRTFPAKGRTDVALGVIPTVIFSEPIDERTLPPGLKLVRGEETVEVEAALVVDQPWAAQLVPAGPLAPETSYELRITRDVRDLDGDSLAAAMAVPFSTTSASAPPLPPPPPPPTPVPPLAPGSIVFTFWEPPSGGSDNNGAALYRMNSDGSDRLRLRSGDYNYADPVAAISPDGTRIAFRLGFGLAIMNADGSGERVIATVSEVRGSILSWSRPAWSPDGTRILFSDFSTGGLSVVDPDGGVVTRLTVPGPSLVCICADFEDAQPDWSPDGTRIVFERWEETSDPELWIMDADDPGTARRLLQERQAGRGPVWSPDGSRIAFAQSSAPTAESYFNRVLLTDANGSAPVLVEQRGEYVRAIGGWTTDGASLVFAVNHVSPANYMQPDLYLLHVATRATARLTTGGVTDSPSVGGRSP